VVTADALHTHPAAAQFLVAEQAHYLFTVKANQPTLLDRCAGLPWHLVPELDRTRDRAHGRVELRTLKAVSVSRFGFPDAAQVVQVTRKVRDLRTRRWRTVTVYAITSLTFEQASPARLADYLRGHWAIENGLHYIRDVTFAEDGSQVRTGTGPQCHGLPAQPRHRPTQPRGAGQPRRRPPSPRPRPHPTPRHPRDHPRMHRTLRENAGALPRSVVAMSSGSHRGRRSLSCEPRPSGSPLSGHDVRVRVVCANEIRRGEPASSSRRHEHRCTRPSTSGRVTASGVDGPGPPHVPPAGQ
jgi:predicted transposase YbfD/YdcC